MAEEFLKTDPIADDEELIVESKRAINYLQVQRNYRYVEFLAQGGYGWVSLVYDDAEKRPLAVKCTIDTSDMELTWWPKLQHDTILPLIEYITLDSCTVFIMPAMRKDLWMCVNEPQFYQDELSFGLCRIWLGDVATALNYLHNQHLCHLDLKLDNVFLKDNGRACLGDFSLLSDSREVPAKFHFLELYEPPEYTDWCHGSAPSAIADAVQFGGDKADMWQYGILALDLLTNLSLSGERSNYFTLWHHDVWPFVQKVLLHKEYMEYLMEDTFHNVFFNELDFELCHEFLEQILIIEPNARASAAEAMRHEFVNVEWPHIPASFGMPKHITAHPSKPRGKKAKQKPSAEEEGEGETAPLEESPSKIPEDVLKKKMEKIQKEKQVRRQSFAAIAGKNPLMIRHNLSGMNVEEERSISNERSGMSDVEVQGNVVIKKAVETNNRNNAGNRDRNTKKVVTSISPYKKLQAKVNRNPAKSTSSQLGRSNRSSTEQVTRFLSSSNRNLRGKSPVKKESEPKGKSPSPGASRSPSVKKSPGNRKNSPTSKKPIGSKKSPTGSKNSPRDEKSASNPRKSKSPSSKKSPEDRKDTTTVKRPSNDKKSPSNPKESEKKRNSSNDQDNRTRGKTSLDDQKIKKQISYPEDRKKSMPASDQKDATKVKTSPDDQKNTTKADSLEERKKSTASSHKGDANPKKSTSVDEKEGRKMSSHELSHQNATRAGSLEVRKRSTASSHKGGAKPKKNISVDEKEGREMSSHDLSHQNATRAGSLGERKKSMASSHKGGANPKKNISVDEKEGHERSRQNLTPRQSGI